MLQTDKTHIRLDKKPIRKRVARIKFDNGIRFFVNEADLPMRIGRDPESDICIPSGHVSRLHCELQMIHGSLCLVDMSSNGTMVGDRLIKSCSIPIRDSVVVSIAGDASLTITPMVMGDLDAERRQDSDRRVAERRQQSLIVPFEQRDGSCRRVSERRQED